MIINIKKAFNCRKIWEVTGLRGGSRMINLTGINNKEFTLNADHIEKVEEVPETLITLTNGKKYLVLESVEEVKNEVLRYKNKIFSYRL